MERRHPRSTERLGLKDMRVLFLLRKMDSNDGITSYCDTLAGGLGAADVPVDLICAGVESAPDEEPRWAGLVAKISVLKFLPHLRKIPDPANFLALRRHIRTHGTTVVNIHGLGMLLWGKVLALTTDLPVVATYHPSVHGAIEEVSQLSQRPLSSVERLIMRWCAPDRLIVLSSESARYLARECPHISERIVIISGAVDDDHFRPPTVEERAAARRALGLDDDVVAILHVGRMSWNKGQDLLIDAVRRVRGKQATPPLRCFFVGSGAEEDQIKERASQQVDDRAVFTFPGFVKDLREVIWATDIFALPSRLEGFALAVVEAMSAGLVAIRTPSGGASDQIVDGESGIIVPFEDVDALAEAITHLSDGTIRAEMRARSLSHTRARFTRAGMTERMMSIYEDVSHLPRQCTEL